jgi:hypothetical protein
VIERAFEELVVTLLAPGEVFPPAVDSPLYVKYRGVELLWSPGRAVLQCEPDAADGLIAALKEFTAVEAALAAIEKEIARAWVEVKQDTAVAFDVDKLELKRSAEVGGRMERAFQRRIRFAQMGPRLFSPATGLAAAGFKLGEELREKAGIEDRAEIVDGQLEVFEHVYEMASQRMGEFRASLAGHRVEMVIVWILVVEALLMAGDMALRLWR